MVIIVVKELDLRVINLPVNVISILEDHILIEEVNYVTTIPPKNSIDIISVVLVQIGDDFVVGDRVHEIDDYTINCSDLQSKGEILVVVVNIHVMESYLNLYG